MSTLTGTPSLVRLGLRRDRVVASVWLLVLLLVCYASAAGTADLYPTERQRVAAAEALDASPAVVALYGPIVDVHSRGELAMAKMTVLYALFVAVMCVVLVRRHTRVEEESGRTELVGAAAVGRDAPLAAAVTESAAVALLLGALAAAVDVAAGLPVAGSLAFGASWAGVGIVAGALTAVACQLSASARSCAAYAVAGIAVLFGLRAVGDVTDNGVGWASPFGWSTRLHAFGETRWWVLLLYVVLAGALVVLARLLRSRRDLGSGLVAERPGPADGSPRLAGAVALAVRVHSTTLVTWTVATAAGGLLLGAIAPQVTDLLDSPGALRLMQRLGGVGALEDTLLAAELAVLAVVVSCFAITVVAHGGSDERDGRTEQVLATATSRAQAFAATVLVAVVGASWLLLVTGIGASVGYGAAADGRVTDLVPAALAHAPAVWVMTALTVLCLALRSSWTVAGWGLLVVFVTLGQVGELLRLPARVLDLSPYTHVPRMPVAGFAVGPELALSLVAAGLLVLSWARYRVRDIG